MTESHDPIDLDVPLGEPPVFIDTAAALSTAAESLAAGQGAIGVDTERASGYRYSQRAYLVQLYRADGGTFLLDPPSIGDVSELARAIGGEEWVLHAASQDLPSLRELGLIPASLFDTELGARLLGYERVGLGSVVESQLNIHLHKAYSAVDWSTRPLPTAWLTYAALDVQLLPRLRDVMREQLAAAGKLDIAAQEFDAVLHAAPKPAAIEPWRRLSGLHSLRTSQQLAVARSLWLARDTLARELDIAPGRLVPDSALLAAIQARPQSKAQLAAVPTFTGRASRSHLDLWWQAISGGYADPEPPTRATPGRTLPPPKAWAERNPPAHERLTRARAALTEIANDKAIPLENLLSPRLLREVAWDAEGAFDSTAPVEDVSAQVDRLLTGGGARPWQRALAVRPIALAFVESRLATASDDSQNS